MSSGLKVCDYITLRFDETVNRVGDVWTWDVNGSYYTDQKSTVCSVELCTGGFKGLAVNASVFTVAYMPGVQNGNTRVIGIGKRILGSNNVCDVWGNIHALVSARPQVISLKLTSPSGATIGLNVVGFIVLKFSYYSQVATQDSFHTELY